MYIEWLPWWSPPNLNFYSEYEYVAEMEINNQTGRKIYAKHIIDVSDTNKEILTREENSFTALNWTLRKFEVSDSNKEIAKNMLEVPDTNKEIPIRRKNPIRYNQMQRKAEETEEVFEKRTIIVTLIRNIGEFFRQYPCIGISLFCFILFTIILLLYMVLTYLWNGVIPFRLSCCFTLSCWIILCHIVHLHFYIL